MRVDEVMTRFPTTIRLGTTARHAAALVAAAELGQLMVLDHDGRFAGILSEGDLLRALLPGAEELRTAGGTVTAGLAAFHAAGRRRADEPVDALVVREPITVSPAADVAAAVVVMADRRLRRLPVVEDGQLRGTVSRIDVCRAVLAHAPVAPAGAGDVAPVGVGDVAAQAAAARAQLLAGQLAARGGGTPNGTSPVAASAPPTRTDEHDG